MYSDVPLDVGYDRPAIRSRSIYTVPSLSKTLDEVYYKCENDANQHSKYIATDNDWMGQQIGDVNDENRQYCIPDVVNERAGYDSFMNDSYEVPKGTAIATPTGIMSLLLNNKVRVDMTIDKAVRVVCMHNNIVVALDGPGSAAALMHYNGRVYQYGSRTEIVAHDLNTGNNKYAKMWYKGVSFTSEECALVYLVDAAGARTTTDTFIDMSHDFSLPLFYYNSRYGPEYVEDAIELLKEAQYWETNEGVLNWIINNIRISQTPEGVVRVGRKTNKYQLRVSPIHGTASITTPFIHCTASLGQTSHLFVRRGERRMHYDGESFIVRNAGHAAGFDNNSQLKVF